MCLKNIPLVRLRGVKCKRCETLNLLAWSQLLPEVRSSAKIEPFVIFLLCSLPVVENDRIWQDRSLVEVKVGDQSPS